MREGTALRHLFEDVIGQPRAVAILRASAARPVHAYLLVGPPGTGKAAAATSFAAAVLCPTGGEHGPDGRLCDSCHRVLVGLHPDVIPVQREGPSIGINVAREVTRSAFLSPVEGGRKVMVLHDFHLVRDTGPALLKTIEEPPASTVFVILAEYLPPDLATIASRCVRVDFDVMRPEDLIAALVDSGVDPARAEQLADVADGRLDRARLLATDPEFELRQRAWASVPDRLDGRGATAAQLVAEVMALMDESVVPLKLRQSAEMGERIERNRADAEVTGAKKARSTKAALNAGLAEMEDRHRREQRRQRTDELRSGLATLAAAYRSRLTGGDVDGIRLALEAVAVLDATTRSLEFNPNETILLQALFARLGRLAVAARS